MVLTFYNNKFALLASLIMIHWGLSIHLPAADDNRRRCIISQLKAKQIIIEKIDPQNCPDVH